MYEPVEWLRTMIDDYCVSGLSRHDLTREEWDDVLDVDGFVAYSFGPTLEVITMVNSGDSGELLFETYTEGISPSVYEGPSLEEALRHHEELAKPIRDRMELMQSHSVSSLATGAL